MDYEEVSLAGDVEFLEAAGDKCQVTSLGRGLTHHSV